MAFSAAAGISLFFTAPRLFLAFKGGDGAPDFLETAGNAAINIGGKIGDEYVRYIYICHLIS